MPNLVQYDTENSLSKELTVFGCRIDLENLSAEIDINRGSMQLETFRL